MSLDVSARHWSIKTSDTWRLYSSYIKPSPSRWVYNMEFYIQMFTNCRWHGNCGIFEDCVHFWRRCAYIIWRLWDRRYHMHFIKIRDEIELALKEVDLLKKCWSLSSFPKTKNKHSVSVLSTLDSLHYYLSNWNKERKYVYRSSDTME